MINYVINAGRKAGYLGGAYYLGNLFGSFIWGMAADKLGRRTVLLMGVFFIIVCELFFGFSQNMLWAVSARLLWGLFNGNTGVAKTYISEVSSYRLVAGVQLLLLLLLLYIFFFSRFVMTRI